MSKLLLTCGGQKAIKILESLGKRNTYKLQGNEICCGYTYNSNDDIVYERYLMNNEDYTVLTVDDYELLYPLMVGDIVRIVNLGDIKPIKSASWDGGENQTLYYIDDYGWYENIELDLIPTTDASPVEECTIIKDSKIKFDSHETELDLGDNYEVVNKGGKWYVTRKSVYPTNYDHCCDVLDIDVSRDIEHSEHLPFYKDINQYDVNLLGCLRQFRKLLICLHAYWKVYGEENGADKPWEPIHKEGLDVTFYTIYRFNGEIKCGATSHRHSILEFPTEELRDMFYSNFKTLIENCKVLL